MNRYVIVVEGRTTMLVESDALDQAALRHNIEAQTMAGAKTLVRCSGRVILGTQAMLVDIVGPLSADAMRLFGQPLDHGDTENPEEKS